MNNNRMYHTVCTLTRSSHDLTHDSQAMHRTLKHDIDGDFLWALPDRKTLVIQHETPVHWPNALPGVIARTHTVDVHTPITGAPIHWALIANPTKSISRGMGKRGKRTPLGPDEWESWVRRKLQDAINIHDLDAHLMPVARGKRHTMTTYHRRVMYTGTGTVANQQTLSQLIRDGVGSGKAYGCGLLITQEVTV